MTEPGRRQRIDKWLFFARLVKSRSLGAKLVELGRVRVNRIKALKPSEPVQPGDVLTINFDRHIAVLRVLDAGERRGPASEARLLYEDLSPQASGDGARAAYPDEAARLRKAFRVEED